MDGSFKCDQNTAIVGYYRPLQEVNQGFRRVKLLGLDPNKRGIMYQSMKLIIMVMN